MRVSILSTLFLATAVFTGSLHAQIRSGGSYLGVSIADIDADHAKTLKLAEERGVEVKEVQEGSPAENAGIKPGDILLSYNGENILGAQQFVRLVQETPQGRRIKLQFWRDGKSQFTTVTTGAPKPHFEAPPGFENFSLPDMRSFSIDIPNPLLVWTNSMLGIECESIDSQLAHYFGVKQGLLVRSVEKGSAAEKAGMKAGDVLTSVGDRTLASPHDMTSYMRSLHQPGKSIPLTLVRDHKELTLNVVPSDSQE